VRNRELSRGIETAANAHLAAYSGAELEAEQGRSLARADAREVFGFERRENDGAAGE